MRPSGHRPAKWIRRRIALLALFALAGIQLVSASHAFSHDELLQTDVCSVCLQLEQFDEVLIAPDAAGLDATPPSVDPLPADERHIAGALRPYAARAPPVS